MSANPTLPQNNRPRAGERTNDDASNLRQRLLRRIDPIIIAIAVGFTALSLFGLISTAYSIAYNTHESSLALSADAINQQVEQYVADATRISTDTAFTDYIVGLERSLVLATDLARELIRQNASEYISIEYVTREGNVEIRITNQSGTPLPITFANGRPAPEIANDPAFRAIINDETTQVTFGSFELVRDNEGVPISPARLALNIYAPVFLENNNFLAGIISLKIDATNLLSTINSADLSLFEPIPGRRLVLINEQGLVVADSAQTNTNYLLNIEAVNGNIGEEPVYQQLLDVGQRNFEQVLLELEGSNLISELPIDIAGVDEVQWQLFFVDDTVNYLRPSLAGAIAITIVGIIFVTVALWLTRRAMFSILSPIETADQMVRQMIQGDDEDTPVSTETNALPTADHDQLVDAVQQIRGRIGELSQQLEVQVNRRNRDMQVAGRIGREMATQADLESLVNRAINLICNELGFYHAQVFLVDELQQYALLSFSRGETGRALLERRHRLAVGSDTIIGRSTGERRPVFVNDTIKQDGEVPHGFNPLLPDTRAEMGLPLIIGDDVIGALDLQSLEAGVFLEEDIPTYQLLADQLAIAIYNARLKEQSDRRISQIDQLNRQLTRQAWQETEEQSNLPVQYGIITPDANEKKRREAPISIRNEVIGNLVVQGSKEDLSEGDQMILQAVAERVSLAVENARLFQETQNTLAETSMLYQLSRQLNEADDLTEITQAIVDTVAPDASNGQVWLFDETVRDDRVAIMVSDLALQQRAEEQGQIILGTRLKHSEHPLMQNFESDSIFYSNNLSEEAGIDDELRELIDMLGAQSLVVIPILMRGVWKGYITLEFQESRNFTEREVRIYEALITQAGVAIDNRLLLQQTEEALTRIEKLYAASRIVNTAQDLSDLVYAAVATADVETIDFWLSILEGEPDETSEMNWLSHARIVARSNDGDIVESNEVYVLEVAPDSPMNNREPEIIYVPEKGKRNARQQWVVDWGYRFMAIFPLFSDNQPIALFTIVAPDFYELSQDDYEVYKALTGQMSTQIENRRLLERTEEALNETRRLYVANRAITDAQDLPALYDAIAGQIAMPFMMRSGQASHISMTLIQPRGQVSTDARELEVVYQWLSDMERTPSLPTGSFLPHESYPLAQAIETSEEGWLNITDLSQDLGELEVLRDVLEQNDATSVAVTAMRSRRNWYGVIILRTNNPDLLTNSYMRFMSSVSDQVAIVLERQRLLTEAETERANLNSILSTLPTGVLVLDFETRIPIRFNERMTELFGREIDPNVVFEPHDYDIKRTGTEIAYPADEMPLNVAAESLRPQFADDLTVIRDDFRIDLLINVVPVLDAQGRGTALIAAFEDISTLRTMENTLQNNLREQVTLYETQRSLVEANNIEDQLDSLIGQLIMQEPSEAFIVLSDVITGETSVARSMMGTLNNADALQGLLRSQLTRIDDRESADDDARAVLGRLGMASALVLPLNARNRERPLGWLMLFAQEENAFNDEQERTLISISDMATTSIDNNVLFQSTQDALAETEALYTATTNISRARDLDELGEALERALDRLQPDMVTVVLLPNEDEDTHYLVRKGWEQAEANGFELQRLAEMNLPQADGIYLADMMRSTLGSFEREILKGDTIRAFAGVNLRIKDVPGGRIFIGYEDAHPFGASEMRYLNTIADSTSIMVDYQLLLGQLRSTLQETSILYQASRALIEVNTPKDVVDVIVDQLIEPHINQVFIASLRSPRWDSAGASVDITASWQSESDIDLMGVALSPDQFPAWEQLASPDVLVINDIYAEDSGLDMLEQASIESLDTRSLVIIPLRVPNREIGAIWLGSHEPYEYSDSAIRIFQRFGEQTSLSLETNYLLEQTERRARQLETSAQISQRVGTILDLDVLLPQVVDLIKEQFQYDHVQVFLMDERNDYAELKASTGEAGRKLLSIKHKLQKGSDSVIGRVTQDMQPTIALDTADANVIHQPNPYLPMTRSEMALPLIIKGEVVGALDVQSNTPNAFIEEDITALRTLASQIAVAIDNARLYEESESRAYEMSFLFDIIANAAAADTLEVALGLVAQRINEDLNALAVAIYLPQTYEDGKSNKWEMMVPTASSGLTAPLNTLTEIKVGDAENLIGLASSTLQAQIVNNIEEEIRYLPLTDDSRSAIITPIIGLNKVIGMIVMESDRTYAYTNETLTLMLTLAGSLSSVVQNALLLQQMQEANERLREIDRLKNQFLANMSHELRTPLNSIIGFSRVMLKGISGPLTEMQEQDLSTIYNSGNHLLNLINDILDQAKIEANQLKLETAYFDIKNVVEGGKSIAVGLLKDKPELEFLVDVAPNLPQAYGDEFRSRQILINLLSNAIKFTNDGGVHLRVYAVHDDDGDVMLRMDVTDSGIGIEEEDLPAVFEQFQQVDSSLTRTAGGTGLGLPISKSLAELQGGNLTVTSQVNVGSTFSITIPTKPKGDDTEETPEEAPDTDTQPTIDTNDTAVMKREDLQKAMRATQNLQALPTKREVLLIEDNKDMVDQFRRVLQREGFEVQTADHPSFAQAMASNLRPNVIIMDVNFANGEGWSILESLKERDDTFDIPIIVNTLSNESERAYRMGAHTFMQRPFAPEDLMNAVLQAEKESNRERILIIDDQPESIRLLMQMLNEHGDFRVFSAEDGEEGISLVARRRPDLIILDLRMPNMDGFAVLSELRANPETADIPVMVVTGELDFNDSEQELLKNIHVIHKGSLSDEAYEAFIEDVRRHLEDQNGK
jgi:GAF domain-containing protein/CheY-like chemotaxis protein/anti-sigma regulatory factor (Ser/Thr protein kinase)